MAFSVFGAWVAAVPIYAILMLLARRLNHVGRMAFWVGIGIGLCPLLMAWLPNPFQFVVAAGVATIGLLPISTHFTPVPAVRMVFTVLCAAFLVVSLFLPSSQESLTPTTYSAASDPRPMPQGIDVFLVSIDTLRAEVLVDDPNSAGDSTAPLPFLHSKQSASLWAEYALSSSNQTLPGHVGMLTGVSAMEHGVRSNSDMPDQSVPLVSEYFQDAGWSTSAVVSNALISSATGMHRGFQYFSADPVGLGVYGELMAKTIAPHTWLGMTISTNSAMRLFILLFSREVLDQKKIPIAERVRVVALEQLEDLYASERPFFQFIHMLDPHVAYAPPPNIRGRLSAAAAAAVPVRFLPHATAKLDAALVRDLEQALNKGELDAETAVATLNYYRLVYLEEMITVDRCLEQIFARADASQRPYVVLFTSDHGEQFGEHNYMEHANSMYRKNLEVPFMLWGNGIVPGKIVGTTPTLTDVPATLLHLAGIEIPDSLSGRSLLLPAIERPFVAADQKQLAVFNGAGLKWIGRWPSARETAENPTGGPLPVALYNLLVDPTEAVNLLEADPLAAESMLTTIDAYIARDTWASRQAGVERSAYQMAALSELGYAGQDAPPDAQ